MPQIRLALGLGLSCLTALVFTAPLDDKALLAPRHPVNQVVIPASGAYDNSVPQPSPASPSPPRGMLHLKWTASMVNTDLSTMAGRWLTDALQARGSPSRAFLPAFFPIMAQDKILFRDYAGLSAVEEQTGDLFWRSIPFSSSLNALLTSDRLAQQMRSLFSRYRHHDVHDNRVFQNSVLGYLSADEAHVYAVDDLVVPPPVSGVPTKNPAELGELRKFIDGNMLVAYSVGTGKLHWVLGTDPRLARTRFLGPPLAIAGRLYVLAQRANKIALVCITPQRGRLLWSDSICTPQTAIRNDADSRIQASVLSHSDGLIVCPTNAGAIVGYDVLARQVCWRFYYHHRFGPHGPTDRIPSAPVVAQGYIVAAPPDSGAVHCSCQRDGAAVWKTERDEDRYLAGVYEDRVLVVGNEDCRGLRLADGAEVWRVKTGRPLGMGFARAGYYYLPVSIGSLEEAREIVVIGVATGRIVGHLSASSGGSLGNLMGVGNVIISQSATEVSAYSYVKEPR